MDLRMPKNWRRTHRLVWTGRVKVGDVLQYRSGRYELANHHHAKYLNPIQHLSCFVFRLR